VPGDEPVPDERLVEERRLVGNRRLPQESFRNRNHAGIGGDGGYRRMIHEVPCARTASIEARRLERPSEFGHFRPVEDGFDDGENLRRGVARVEPYRVCRRAN
jgi:hypothetical protein